MVTTKKFILVKYCQGFPKSSDFQLVEEELPPLKENEYLAEAVYLSVDPYMRAYMSVGGVVSENDTMIGSQIAKIIESRNPKFPVGRYVFGDFGWRTHTIVNEQFQMGLLGSYLLPDFEDLPLSLGLGVLGMPGNTAYFGFLEICDPKPGETVVVSGAAGAVGSIVGQIAKIKGCTSVIGITGSDIKGKWVTEELGFDHFINYKTQNVDEELTKLVPQKVDCYFDNVGGEISASVMKHMNLMGRVAICGLISSYNDESTIKQVTSSEALILFQQLKLEGFIVTRWNDRWLEGIQQNLKWIKEGKLKYKETVTEGFENMFNAFIDMLKGGNTGKAIVKV